MLGWCCSMLYIHYTQVSHFTVLKCHFETPRAQCGLEVFVSPLSELRPDQEPKLCRGFSFSGTRLCASVSNTWMDLNGRFWSVDLWRSWLWTTVATVDLLAKVTLWSSDYQQWSEVLKTLKTFVKPQGHTHTRPVWWVTPQEICTGNL